MKVLIKPILAKEPFYEPAMYKIKSIFRVRTRSFFLHLRIDHIERCIFFVCEHGKQRKRKGKGRKNTENKEKHGKHK